MKEKESRSQAEIVARIQGETEDDFFGFRREVLLEALDYQHARSFLNPEVTEAKWDAARTRDVAAASAEYLEFAIEKIRDHRGISASRSVQKLAEYAWLLGRDDVVAAMKEADYQNYGAPKIKVFAEGLGLPWPDSGDLNRMVQGLPCDDDCIEGCAR